MKSFSKINRKNVFLTTLATAAAVAAVGLTTNAGAATSVNTYWIGPSGDSSQGGSWDSAANWVSKFSANSTNYTGHWIPGTNGTGNYDSSITPSGPSGGYSDSGYIMGLAGNSTGYTVTMSGNYQADAAYLNGLNVNAGFHYSTAPNPNSPVILDIQAGAYLPTTLAIGGSGSYGATVNVAGTVNAGSLRVGAAVGASGTYSQTTSTLNIESGGYVTVPGNQWGFSVGADGANGVLNIQSGGKITVGYPGSIVLGANAPVVSSHGTFTGYGTMNQTGGTTSVNRSILVGYDTNGTFNMSGGTDTIGGLEVASYGQGTFNLSGGVVTSQGAVIIAGLGEQGINAGASGSPTGLITITGGTLAGSNLSSGNSSGSGTAELQIVGTGGTLNFAAGAGASGMQTFANSTLDFQIGSGGVSTITADGGGSTSTQNDTRDVVALSGTLELDLLGGFTPVTGQVYTLITTNVVTATNAAYMGIVTTNTLLNNYSNNGNYQNTGLSLAAMDNGLWSFNVVVNAAGTATELQATYIGQPTIPEPATLGLMAVAGAGLLLIGRRKRA